MFKKSSLLVTKHNRKACKYISLVLNFPHKETYLSKDREFLAQFIIIFPGFRQQVISCILDCFPSFVISVNNLP